MRSYLCTVLFPSFHPGLQIRSDIDRIRIQLLVMNRIRIQVFFLGRIRIRIQKHISPEYATGWKGGGEGREGGGVVGRPHFEGANLSSRAFFKAFKKSTKCLGSGIRVLKPDPDPEKFKHRIRIQAKSPDPTWFGSGSATLLPSMCPSVMTVNSLLSTYLFRNSVLALLGIWTRNRNSFWNHDTFSKRIQIISSLSK